MVSKWWQNFHFWVNYPFKSLNKWSNLLHRSSFVHSQMFFCLNTRCSLACSQIMLENIIIRFKKLKKKKKKLAKFMEFKCCCYWNKMQHSKESTEIHLFNLSLKLLCWKNCTLVLLSRVIVVDLFADSLSFAEIAGQIFLLLFIVMPQEFLPVIRIHILFLLNDLSLNLLYLDTQQQMRSP